MKTERDLLPWILGGLSAAGIAVAFAAVSTHRDATISPPRVIATSVPAAALPADYSQQGSAQTPAAPRPATTQAAPLPAEPNAAASVPPLSQASVVPEVPSGQIWECTTNGVKTFSNNPCGDKSTLMDVGPINTMAAIHYMGPYGSQPRYAAGYPDQSGSGADEYSDQYAADTGGSSYAILGVVARRRPVQFHRPPVQPAPPSHRNPAPVRRN
jgi:hypothetical protein